MLRNQNTYFVKHHSDSLHNYSEADINGILGFIDNTYVVVGDQVFQQSVGIPMGIIVPLYWQTYEVEFVQKLLRDKNLAVSFNNTHRYIDALPINNHNFTIMSTKDPRWV
jgi:hypothetical protein